jgi:TetR/AcrR family transcriptional regulator, cholesterol catabolism regulator
MPRAVRKRSGQPAAGQSAANLQRDEIVDIAGKLFAKNSYDRTTVRDLSNEFGVNVAMIYYYFPDKCAIFCTYLERAIATMERTVGEAVRLAGARPRDQLYAYVKTHVQYQLENRDMGRIFHMRMFVLEDATPQARKRIHDLEARYFRMLHGIIKKGVDEDAFKVDEVAPTTFALFGIGEHINTWYRPTGPLTPEQVGSLYARLGLRLVGLPS